MSDHHLDPDFGIPRGYPRLDVTDPCSFAEPGDAVRFTSMTNVHPTAVVDMGPRNTELLAPAAPYGHKTGPRSSDDFQADVLRGLAGTPRAIPSRWLYDHRGSQLFEEITALPEYYPTRVERAILKRHARDIAELAGAGRAVVEFGSGSSSKTRLLLSAINASAYIPIDISGSFLRESSAALSKAFPELPIHPIEADFTRSLTLPAAVGCMPRLGFFPGSTIGNLNVPTAVDVLRAMAITLGNGMLLIGVDRIKEVGLLLPAYDDRQGITAEFNLNLLRRINRELGGSIPIDAFKHRVRWNEMHGRIEMHLEALRDLRFVVGGRTFSIATGETIHTENSFKYGCREAHLLLRAGGWTPIADWSDDNGLFSLILAESSATPVAP